MPDTGYTGYTLSRDLLAATADVCGLRPGQVGRRVRRAFQDLVVHSGTTVTLEVGAFEADFSRWARGALPDARVVAFEANPFVHERFRAEVEATGVEYVHACVGDTSGPVTLHVPRDFRSHPFAQVNQMASLVTSPDTEVQEQVEVPGVRLPDVVPLGADDVVAAWIDVEGALGRVLPGSEETLRRASVVFVEVETEPVWEGQWLDTDVAAWFADIGMVPLLRDLQRPWQYNLVLVSRDLARDPAVVRRAAEVLRPGPAPAPSPTHPLRARVEGLVRPGLRREVEQVRAQNRRLRRRLRQAEAEAEGQAATQRGRGTPGPRDA